MYVKMTSLPRAPGPSLRPGAEGRAAPHTPGATATRLHAGECPQMAKNGAGLPEKARAQIPIKREIDLATGHRTSPSVAECQASVSKPGVNHPDSESSSIGMGDRDERFGGKPGANGKPHFVPDSSIPFMTICKRKGRFVLGIAHGAGVSHPMR